MAARRKGQGPDEIAGFVVKEGIFQPGTEPRDNHKSQNATRRPGVKKDGLLVVWVPSRPGSIANGLKDPGSVELVNWAINGRSIPLVARV